MTQRGYTHHHARQVRRYGVLRYTDDKNFYAEIKKMAFTPFGICGRDFITILDWDIQAIPQGEPATPTAIVAKAS